MENLKQIISENLTYLRKKNKLTQNGLAEKINYSDNAISRWERGDVTPTIEVLQILANYYGVTVNDLISENLKEKLEKDNSQRVSKVLTIIFSISVVWFVIVVAYIYLNSFNGLNNWTLFVAGIPISCLVGMYYNRKWGNRVLGVVLASIFAWSVISLVYLTYLEYNMWLVFLLGLPMQSALISGYFLRPTRK